MATVAFLFDRRSDGIALRPAIADRLAHLGVTNVSLFRDRDVVCVVLEGWAFDPSSSTDAAAAAIGADANTRTLRPLMQTALRATREET